MEVLERLAKPAKAEPPPPGVDLDGPAVLAWNHIGSAQVELALCERRPGARWDAAPRVPHGWHRRRARAPLQEKLDTLIRRGAAKGGGAPQ